MCMKKSEISENKNIKTIDTITKIVSITISVILGSIFLGACVYLLTMINDSQTETKPTNNATVQNINLVNM